MGFLVGQHELQPLGAFQRRRVQIDGGMKQPVQAGAGQLVAEVHRQTAGDFGFQIQLASLPPQPQRKAKIRPQQRPAGEHSARRPDERQQRRRIQRPFRVRFAAGNICNAAGNSRLHPAGCGLGKVGFRGGAGLNFGIRRGGQGFAGKFSRAGKADLRRVRQGVHHAGPALGQADRQQQPQQHKAPQGVLHPAADPPRQQRPRRQHRQNQQTGCDEQFDHAITLLFRRGPFPESSAAGRARFR